ncbi:serine/threonine-protein kinase [Spirillospora sp. CA-142024]|uniref:serine/threonine-protein kinase n=1 Tax=Spirillospora sp. CA-142024 TaxID=3240036 RepID=UPI003D92FC35
MVAPLRAGDPARVGRYRLTGLLGEGGQGAVYEAEGPDGGRVAVKVLHSRFAADEAALRRFVREVDATRRVAGFCTAAVLEVSTVGAAPFIVSELVDGEPLSALVARDGPRDGGALERLAVGTATALSAIHRAGIVHRDFKPSNVLLGPDGPRVIDFGIALSLDAMTTLSSGPVGTPAYMSPEQITGAEVGPLSDVFAWGVTMVFAATGRPAFGDDTVPAVMNRVLHEQPDLSGLSRMPGTLPDLVAATLDKKAAARPSATDVMMSLLGHRDSGPEAAPRRGARQAASLAPEPVAPPRGRRRWWAGGAVTAVVLAAAAGVAIVLFPGNGRHGAPAANASTPAPYAAPPSTPSPSETPSPSPVSSADEPSPSTEPTKTRRTTEPGPTTSSAAPPKSERREQAGTVPKYVRPSDGDSIDYDGAYRFKVTPVRDSSGYLYGFFQHGDMVWENYRDEGRLSGTDYAIEPGSDAHSHFRKGTVDVWVRAYVHNQWTAPTIITIHLT